MTKPIFIFSLPRAGSTLLQRMLLAHPKIGGTAEPWLLLPFVYTIKDYGTFTEYGHGSCYNAFTDFIETLPEKDNTYLNHLSDFANQLYSDQLKDDEIYFLDKTPRYYLIIPEIVKMYPEAKFIFLFRNPLAVLSSIIDSWYGGKMRLHAHYIDLMIGPRLLAEAHELLKDKSLFIKYEDLITNTDDTLASIFDYLDIEHDEDIKNKFNEITLSGRKGDNTGRYEYNKVEKVALEKWKRTLNTRRRKTYAKKYLQKIGTDVLEIHGYNHNELITQVNSIKIRKLGYLSDNYNLTIGFLLRILEYRRIGRRVKEKLLDRNKPFIQHT